MGEAVVVGVGAGDGVRVAVGTGVVVGVGTGVGVGVGEGGVPATRNVWTKYTCPPDVLNANPLGPQRIKLVGPPDTPEISRNPIRVNVAWSKAEILTPCPLLDIKKVRPTTESASTGPDAG